LGRQVSGTRNLAVAPGVYVRQFTNRSIPNQLPDTIEITDGVTLRADLGRQLILVLQVRRPDSAGLVDTVCQRLFAIDVQPAIHSPIGHKGVRLIRRAADHGVQVFLFQALPPVDVRLGAGKLVGRFCQMVFVHVAQRHDVFGLNGTVVRRPAAPYADQTDIQFVAGRGGPGLRPLGKRSQPALVAAVVLTKSRRFMIWVSWSAGNGRGRDDGNYCSPRRGADTTRGC